MGDTTGVAVGTAAAITKVGAGVADGDGGGAALEVSVGGLVGWTVGTGVGAAGSEIAIAVVSGAGVASGAVSGGGGALEQAIANRMIPGSATNPNLFRYLMPQLLLRPPWPTDDEGNRQPVRSERSDSRRCANGISDRRISQL